MTSLYLSGFRGKSTEIYNCLHDGINKIHAEMIDVHLFLPPSKTTQFKLNRKSETM